MSLHTNIISLIITTVIFPQSCSWSIFHAAALREACDLFKLLKSGECECKSFLLQFFVVYCGFSGGWDLYFVVKAIFFSSDALKKKYRHICSEYLLVCNWILSSILESGLDANFWYLTLYCAYVECFFSVDPTWISYTCYYYCVVDFQSRVCLTPSTILGPEEVYKMTSHSSFICKRLMFHMTGNSSLRQFCFYPRSHLDHCNTSWKPFLLTVVERNTVSWMTFAAQKWDLFRTVCMHAATLKRIPEIPTYYVIVSIL